MLPVLAVVAFVLILMNSLLMMTSETQAIAMGVANLLWTRRGIIVQELIKNKYCKLKKI